MKDISKKYKFSIYLNLNCFSGFPKFNLGVTIVKKKKKNRSIGTRSLESMSFTKLLVDEMENILTKP